MTVSRQLGGAFSSVVISHQSTMTANRRNMVCSLIAMVMLFVQERVTRPRLLTEEPVEHTFGGWTQDKNNATVKECIEGEEKRSRRTNAIFESNLAVSRDPQSGYHSTWGDFVRFARGGERKDEVGGVVKIPIEGEGSKRPVIELV